MNRDTASKQEGVVKFNLEFTPTEPLAIENFAELTHWRQILFQEALIGQDPQRYGGYGFGNISVRVPPWDAPLHQRTFLISGTQTGGLAHLSEKHYALVRAWQPAQNRVIAEGPLRPSSESLTHGAVYDLATRIRVVMHVHSPELWQHAADLDIPITNPAVPYGSPEMAAEVAHIYHGQDLEPCNLFSMGGHEDGIVAFGDEADQTGKMLLDFLEQAQRLFKQID